MTKTRWLARHQLHAWVSLQRGMALLNDALDAQLSRDAGITHATYKILAMLSEAPGRARRMTDLARATSSSQSRLSHAVARLEELGWVRREACASDRRGSLAVLSDSGFAVLEDAAPGHVAAVRASLFDLLGPGQAEQLAAIFHSVAVRLDPEATLTIEGRASTIAAGE